MIDKDLKKTLEGLTIEELQTVRAEADKLIQIKAEQEIADCVEKENRLRVLAGLKRRPLDKTARGQKKPGSAEKKTSRAASK